jgi:hypothetical protein
MIATILRWLAGGGISAIGEQINRWQEIRAKAETDSEKLEADIKIAQLQGRVEAMRSADRIVLYVQAIWAAPFIIYNWKLIVWDKVLGAWTEGRTDTLPVELWTLQGVIVGFFFLTVATRGR